jgi:hypothetical protein
VSPALPIARSVPAGFVRREVSIAPDDEVAFDASDWRDAIVYLAVGTLEVEDTLGFRGRFESGAILCFDGMPVRAMRNAGVGPLVLVALSRCTDPSPARAGGGISDLNRGR